MNLYKKYTKKPYSFLVIDTAPVSDNTYDTVIHQKLRYDINREAEKISALSSDKIDDRTS